MNQGNFMIFEKKDNFGVLTINNPPNNILGLDFYEEFAEFQQIVAMENVRALVINATGKHFSAGINLANLKDVVDSNYVMHTLPWLQKVYGHWQDLNIPVIAAVQGLCLGSGVELILGCDIRISADNAKYAVPEVQFGLSPDMGGTTRLTRLVGPSQAKRLILSCEQIDAAEALRIGLVDEVVKLEELNDRAFALAKKMATLPEAAINFAKRGINLAAEGGTYAGLLFEQAQSTYCCGTYDKNEGIAAFLEKRAPKYK